MFLLQKLFLSVNFINHFSFLLVARRWSNGYDYGLPSLAKKAVDPGSNPGLRICAFSGVSALCVAVFRNNLGLSWIIPCFNKPRDIACNDISELA